MVRAFSVGRAAAVALAGHLLLPAAGAAATHRAAHRTYTVRVGTAVVAGHREHVLVNGKGFTLYYLDGSTAAKVGCTGACAKYWPPLLLKKGAASVPKGLRGVGVAKTALGRQVLFRGHPLFLFVSDKKPGEALGQGVKKVWWVATTSLKALSSHHKKSSSTSANGGW